MIKVSEIKGRAVIGLESAQKLGALQGLVVDPNTSQAVGLRIGGAEGQHTFVLPASALYRIGPDALTVREAALSGSGENPASLQGLPDTHALGSTKVVTDGGTLLGSITDIYVDETSLQVMGYELAGPGWEHLLGRGRFLPAQPGYRYGGELLLVPDQMAAALGQPGQPQTEAPLMPTPAATQPAPPMPAPAPRAAAPPAPAPPAAGPPAAWVPAHSAPTEQVSQGRAPAPPTSAPIAPAPSTQPPSQGAQTVALPISEDTPGPVAPPPRPPLPPEPPA